MRANRVKSKNTERYYVIKDVYHKGSRTSKTVKSLGTKEQILAAHPGVDPFQWAKEQAAAMTAAAKQNEITLQPKYASNVQLPLTTFTGGGQGLTSPLRNIGYLFLQDIYHDLRLDQVTAKIAKERRFQFDLDEALANLIYARILAPNSKRASLDFAQNFLEPPEIKLDQLYHALSVLAQESETIEAAVYKNSLKVIPRNTKILYYDCSNFFFEIEQEDGFKRYGRSKEHRPNPIVQMGLFIDGSGMPLAFKLNPGNTNEQTTLRPLEKRILKDFHLSKVIVCTDAGLSSRKNRMYNSTPQRSYITTQSVKMLPEALKESLLDPLGWRIADSNKLYDLEKIDHSSRNKQTYYKDIWIPEERTKKGVISKNEERLIITYSPVYRNYQRTIRARQIDRAQRNADDPNYMKRKRANDPKRFIKERHVTNEGELAGKAYYTLDEEAIAKEERYDGFYAVCTDLDSEPQEIVAINHGRWEIEQCFRMMKHEFDARPIYLQREDRIQAHFLICFLSLLIFRILNVKVQDQFDEDDPYTSKDILHQLQAMEIEEIPGEGYIPKYHRTKLTDCLHQTFGFRTDYEAISKKSMQKILTQTKKHKSLR